MAGLHEKNNPLINNVKVYLDIKSIKTQRYIQFHWNTTSTHDFLNIYLKPTKLIFNKYLYKKRQETYRSSRSEVFCKKGVFKNLAKFTCARVSF